MARLTALLDGLLRWGFGLAVLVLVLGAFYVSLGRQLVPLVAEYRVEFEQRARDSLRMPLTLGRLEGRWQGLAPVLLLHDLQLGEGAGRVRLDQVRLVPDLLASLLAWQPRMAALELQGLQLGLRQAAGGAWILDGWPARGEGPPLDVAQLLERLQQVGRLSLLDSQLTLQPLDQPPFTLTYMGLNLRTGGDRLRLDARLTLPDGQPLALSLRSRVQPQRWRQAQAELYLSLPQSDWARWLPAAWRGDWRLTRLQAGGEVWLDWADGGVRRAVARLYGPELAGGYADRPDLSLQNLSLNAYFTRRAEGLDLQLDSLAFSQGDTRWGEAQLVLSRRTENAQAHWQLHADRLDLAPLGRLVGGLAPEAVAAFALGLRPEGAVRNLRLDYRPQANGAERLQFAANLERVGFDAYRGAPAARNVSGRIDGDLTQGEVRLAAEQFALHLSPLFAKPWQYRRADARLLWRLDEQAFTLSSPYLQVDGEEGRLAGDFLIRLMRDPAAEDYMDLRVGLREGDARFTGKYLPEVLSPALRDWLKTAIRGGRVEAGYFQYQGALNKGAEAAARSLSLFFAVHAAELAFQPGWPALREARGEVLVEDSGVRVRLSEGRLLDSRIATATATIPQVNPGQVSHLLLDAELQSSVGDALKILQEAPLGTADLFAGWQGEGALQGALKLDLPLAKGQTPPQVRVDFASQGARLVLANPSLELTELTGAFRFDSTQGLSAPSIRAQVLGHEVSGKALAEGRPGQPRTRIEARGSVALERLNAWLGVTRPLPLSGVLPYRLDLSLDGLDSQLRVDSNLQGLAILLPAPFGKTAEEARASQWRMTLQGPRRRYWLDYGELASAALEAPLGRLSEGRGELLLGLGKARLPTDAGLYLRGRLETLDLAAWQALKPYAQAPDPQAQRLFRGAQLQVGRFIGFGQTLDNLALQLARDQGNWLLDLDSARLKGRVAVPDAEKAPIAVKLSLLRLPAAAPKPAAGSAAALAAQEVEAPDPLAGFDPRSIPPLDIRIDRLLQGDSLLGSWSLKVRPSANGIALSELDLGLKGLQLTGSAGWEGTPGTSSSWYQGRLQGGDLAEVLKAWDFAPSVNSERFRLDMAGRWPGSPAWFSLKRFSGTLDASLRNGQFVEVQGSGAALRLFGVLNFNTIGRRLRLDFSDLLDKGLSYDRVKGVLAGTDGVFVTREPLTLTGPSSNLELNGRLDMVQDRIDASLQVALPLSNNLPLAALIVGAPAIGGALFVVDKLLGDRVARFASVQYKVTGPLSDPQLNFDRPFEQQKEKAD